MFLATSLTNIHANYLLIYGIPAIIINYIWDCFTLTIENLFCVFCKTSFWRYWCLLNPYARENPWSDFNKKYIFGKKRNVSKSGFFCFVISVLVKKLWSYKVPIKIHENRVLSENCNIFPMKKFFKKQKKNTFRDWNFLFVHIFTLKNEGLILKL